jgi:hypothetical protein
MDRIIRRASVAPPPLAPPVADEIVAPRSRRAAALTEPAPATPAPPTERPVEGRGRYVPDPRRTDTLPSVPRSGIVSTREDDEEPSSSSG